MLASIVRLPKHVTANTTLYQTDTTYHDLVLEAPKIVVVRSLVYGRF